MQRFRTLLLILGVLLFCSQAFAQQVPAKIYVTDGTGGDIYSFTTPSGPFAIVATIAGHTLEGIEYGPDGRLFVCDPTNGIVYRVNPSGPIIETVFAYLTSGPHNPQCGRFSSTGDFYVVDEFLGSGVWKFSAASLAGSLPASPTLVLSGAQLSGSGFGRDSSLTHANNGDLLISDFSSGKLFLSAAPSFASASQIASGLNNQTGIARSSTGDIFIANKGVETNSNRVQRFSSTGTFISDCGIFTGGDQPYFIKFSADDTLYVATSQLDSEDSLDPLNTGKIWTVNPASCAGTPALVATMPTPPSEPYDEPVAAIGIALPPTSTVTKTATFTTSKVFNFGFTSYQLNATGSCTVSVKGTQTPPASLTPLIPGLGLPSPTTLIPYLGEAGFATVYQVDPGVGGCTPTSALIGAFTDPTAFTNPRLIQCDNTPAGCVVDTTTGIYPLGGPVPGDGAVGGGVPHFSKFFLVNSGVLTSTTGTDKAAKFCGFQFPLKNTLDLAIAPKFDDDDFILLSFRLALSTGNCKTGPFVDNAKVVVSLSQISPSFIPITNPNNVVTPNINGALFLHTYFGLIKVHGLPVGTYSLSYVFTTNNSPIVTTVFKVVP
jgi:hypothetical protein